MPLIKFLQPDEAVNETCCEYIIAKPQTAMVVAVNGFVFGTALDYWM